MAQQYTVTWTGLKELEQKMLEAPEKVVAEVSKAVEKSALTVESLAKREAPVNKGFAGGTLRQSIRTNMVDRLTARVTAFAKYSGVVEGGSRPHLIRPVRARVLANAREHKFFGKLVHHPGTRPNPFMKRSIIAARPKIEQYFKQALAAVLG